ncbi:MAG: diheme cytochrome c-553 [Ignavibacteriae bacterium]|nr:diheme cytochrome c-553 [Ignavibacteriota bacterium]
MNRSFRLPAIVLAGVLFAQAASAQKTTGANKKLVERGKYLVTIALCNDCHSPKKFGPNGPEVDESKLLSGAPSHTPLPESPAGVLGPDKWGVVASNDLTTWFGPWGISFAKNLTPDVETGIGSWTEDMFIRAIRTGKDMGEGRQILPPMPWQLIGKATDADLKAMFAYLKSLPSIKNAVHEPIPPSMGTVHEPIPPATGATK